MAKTQTELILVAKLQTEPKRVSLQMKLLQPQVNNILQLVSRHDNILCR